MSERERPVALVTGAAGDIGQATAAGFARRGYDVAVFDRRPDLLTETAEKCAAEGARVHAAGVDQTDYEAVRAGLAEVVSTLGPITALFANAGYGKFGELTDQPLKEWHRHVDVNLNGTYFVTREVANAMIAAGKGGSIVINASSGATQYSDLLGAYCVTKAALRMLATGLASELGNHRIRVNAVEPGVVETGMTGPMLNGEQGKEHRAFLLSDTPVGRLGVPDDIAELVLFLSAERTAGFITGAGVPIDGGQVIHGHPRWYRSDYRVSGKAEWEVPR
ncbi:SDR family NAD(P)-dependent oxidoreductase [Amycolatopsis sp. Poz14]|uniref:SDR family NAD(P)-dependent oxidoreductase n=1 Tax=Amycolatopsis sp. Poz14 TaxID=1447705 RepID=UPI001EE83294|nr:SDR family NAD(P)-dependent oxidoreductase [Amycolatopsis sp. Poz14]MCG3753958.1 SDR family oxidoreductase [Amycolatopsis sp. Poz14]